jgi:hypothetical protein
MLYGMNEIPQRPPRPRLEYVLATGDDQGLFCDWDTWPAPPARNSYQDAALRRHRMVRRWQRDAGQADT